MPAWWRATASNDQQARHGSYTFCKKSGGRTRKPNAHETRGRVNVFPAASPAA